MSVENLKEYARRCATEPELRDKARALGVTDMEQYILHAKSLGLEWTANDMVAFRKEVLDAAGGIEDLTEEELAEIAGGGVTTTAAVAVGVVAGVAGGVAVGGAVGTAAGGAATAAAGGGW